MIERHLTKIKSRHDISATEEAAIHAAVSSIRDYPAGSTIVRAGEPLTVSMVLLDGFIARYKDFPDGRRQITEVHVPGDPPDLHSFTLKTLEHNIIALSDSRLAIMPHDRLTPLFEALPRLSWVYWFETNVDASIHREWAVSLGRRTALERVAAFLCEMQKRLAVVGLADETGYGLPISQVDLAECLGLTPVHVNRKLRELRERGLAEFRNHRVKLPDLGGLQDLANFDDAYLYLGKGRHE